MSAPPLFVRDLMHWLNEDDTPPSPTPSVDGNDTFWAEELVKYLTDSRMPDAALHHDLVDALASLISSDEDVEPENCVWRHFFLQ